MHVRTQKIPQELGKPPVKIPNYFTAMEVARILGVSRSRAYEIVTMLNEEWEMLLGTMPEPGKVDRRFFEERFGLFGLSELVIM